jgi:uncharacterized membrane protein YbhN (UPF0104 family)
MTSEALTSLARYEPWLRGDAVRHRLFRIAAWLTVALLVALLFHLFGADLEAWFSRLWKALVEVDVEDVVLGLGLQTLETFLAGLAWVAILRAAYPQAVVRILPVLTCYAVAVAGNDILPASLGTLIMLAMYRAIIHGATFPGLVGGEVVHKLFYVVAGAIVYLYLFATVSESFGTELGAVRDHRWLTGALVAVAVIGGAVVIWVSWSKLRGLWKRAKQGGAILSDKKAYALRVVLPEFGSWLCKLAVIAVFLAAYGIPVTVHTVMSVAGGNSLASVASVTPGGMGVNQAVNSVTLKAEGVDLDTALAYSTGHQVLSTAWNLSLALVLVAAVFGWAGGRQLIAQSYEEAKVRAHESKPHLRLRPEPAEEAGEA